jgi:protein TonB
MNASRLISAGIFAAITTVALVLLMHQLINHDWEKPDEKDNYRFSDVRMPDRDIETQYDQEKPEKPDEPEDVPDIPEPDFDAPDVSADAVNIAAPNIESTVDVSFGNFKSDGEYLPIVRVEPIYPTRAASRGVEGYVIVEFTVTSNGSVMDPVIVEAEPSSIFNSAAERAVLKWKYKPRVVDGTPVDVPGVRTMLTFKLDQ